MNRIARGRIYRCSRLFSDKLYLELLFPLRVGYKLNIVSPQTFCEKLQWLKIYNRRPEYIKMVDKVEAKKYVARIIGENYIIPTLGIYEKAEEIDFGKLPSKFVLKCTHDSGSIVVCLDKKRLDIDGVVGFLKKKLGENYFFQNREWPYKEVKPRIIAEQFLDNHGADLMDYKFFCFHGIPRYCQVISNRKGRMSIDFFDEEWNHQPFHEPRKYPFSSAKLPCPKNFKMMLKLARKLSCGHYFLRVDFYEVDDCIYFGELTFYPTSGMGGFEPMEWDYKFGDLIHLPGADEKSCTLY